jgi:hypothetical protein
MKPLQAQIEVKPGTIWVATAYWRFAGSNDLHPISVVFDHEPAPQEARERIEAACEFAEKLGEALIESQVKIYKVTITGLLYNTGE